MIKCRTKNGKTRIKLDGKIADLAADTIMILNAICNAVDNECAGEGDMILEAVSVMLVGIRSPIKPGDEVYWILEDFDGWYVSGPEKVNDVGTLGFYIGDRDDRMCDDPSFYPWDELGKTAFLSQAEAEAALAKMVE